MKKQLFFLYKKGIIGLTLIGLYKNKHIKKLLKPLFLKLKPEFTQIYNHKMYLDEKDTLGLSLWGQFEPEETEYFMNNIKNGDVIIDIGANIGYYTLIFARLVGNNGHVYAFEPEPDNFKTLTKNIKINGYSNVTLIQKAVSNKTQKLKLYINTENRGDHRIYDIHDGRNYVEIDAITLDDYFKDKNKKIDIIKIDIQGAEASAIEGGKNLIKTNTNIRLITEYEPEALTKFGTTPTSYLELLESLGFALFELEDDNKKITRQRMQELKNSTTLKNRVNTNLLCVKTI